MPRVDTETSAEAHYREKGAYALSGWSASGLSADEIARAVGAEWLPHGRLRQSTVERLTAAGFDVTPSEPPLGAPPLHVDINLPGPITEEIFLTLDSVFDSPQPNPVAKPRR